MEKVRVAMAGLAHPHISALYSMLYHRPDDFDVIGFADVEPLDDDVKTRASRVALMREKIPDIREFANWRDIVAEKPDLVVVTSDNRSRGEVCCSFLENGINVLVEKPMAMDFADASRMVQTAKAHNTRILTNWPIAWFPAFRMAKKLLDEGKIGKLMRVTYRSPATWGPFSYSKCRELPPDEELAKSWWYRTERGGGSLLDYACYGAVLSTWMFGKQAEAVSGITKNFAVTGTNVEDYSAMILDFGNGVGLLEGSWSTYNPGEVPTGPVLYGTDGVIVCDRRSDTLKLYQGRTHKPVPPTETINSGEANQDQFLGDSLLAWFREGKEVDEMIGEALNLAVVATLDAGRKSAHTGITVKTETL